MNHRTNISTATCTATATAACNGSANGPCTAAATGRLRSTATAGRRFLAFAALMLVAAFGLAGRAQAQSIGLQPNYNDETFTVTVTGEGASGITTIYWITDASQNTPSFTPPSTDSETGEAISSDWNEATLTNGSAVIPVDTVAGGRYLHVRIYLAESDDVDAHYQVLRYAVPMASRVASRFRFTVTLAATDGVSVTNDADSIKWSKASSTAAPAALTLTNNAFTYGNGVDGTATGQDTNFEYYTTYSFRAYRASQPERFPSEALTVSTDRYHLPTVVGFSPYSTATALAENASGRFSSNSPRVYVNNRRVDDENNLVTPLPGNAATCTDSLDLNHNDNSHPHQSARFEYDQPRMLVVAAAPAGTDLDRLNTTAFPSAPVTVDTTYSDRVVFHYRDAQGHLHYLSLSANDAVRDHDTLDYTCLWQRDAYSNTLYHTGSDGRARYLQMGSNGYMTVATGSGTSFAIDGTVIMNAVNRSQVMVYSSGGRWSSAANAASDANAKVHYIVSCRQSRSGYFNEVTSCKVNTLAVSTGNGANDYFPLWLALDEAVLDSFNLAATPHIIVTKYRLPSHEHYFIHCANNATHDFTYYNGHSYVNHRLLPGTRSTTIINSNTDIPIGSVSYEWSVLQDTNRLFTIRQNGSANATVKRNTNTFSSLTASEEYQLQVKAIYTIPGTQNNGETITDTSEFKSLPLFAERNATALIPEPNSLTPNDDDIFHDGHYYLLRNYRTLADSTKAYLSGEMRAAGNDFARITTQEEAERVFIVRDTVIGDSTFYSFEDPALDVEDNTADHLYLKWTGIDLYCRIHPNAIFASGTPGHLSDSMLFFLTPYNKDGQGHTYFTMRPRGASPHQSMMPNNADIATGEFLTLMTSHQSHYTYSDDEAHQHRHTADMGKDAFYASRWELVDPKLLPPQITMDGTGRVTLTDFAGELRGVGGHLYWQTKPNGGAWSNADSSEVSTTTTLSAHQVTLTRTFQVGDSVRAWKNAYSDVTHRYFENSRNEEFVVTQVNRPRVAIVGNQVTVTASTGDTIHWTTGELTGWRHVPGPVASFSLGDTATLHVYASAPNKLNSVRVDTAFVPQLTLIKDEDNSYAPDHDNRTAGVLKFRVVIDRGNGTLLPVDPQFWTIKYTIDNNDPEGSYAYSYYEGTTYRQAGTSVQPLIYNPTTGIVYSDFVNVKAYAYPAAAEEANYKKSELYEELLDGRYYTFCYLTPDPDRERHERTNNFLLIDLANQNSLINCSNLASSDYNYNRSDINLTDDQRLAQRTPETYRWMGSVVANTPSYIRNAETGAYLTLDTVGENLTLHVSSNPKTQWTWTGEWTGDYSTTSLQQRIDSSTVKYMLKTTIGTGINAPEYYLVFDTVNTRWTFEAATNENTRRQVAFRTTTVDYCKDCPNEEGHDFLPEGNRLFIQMHDTTDFQEVGKEGGLVWAAMHQNQSMRFQVVFHGQDITYKANQDINIIRPEYSTGNLINNNTQVDEDDPDFFSPWQQWHRYKVLDENLVPTGDTAFTQYYTGVDGYKMEKNWKHKRDSLTVITWKYNGTALRADGQEHPLDSTTMNNSLFKYRIDTTTPDILTVTRTGTITHNQAPNQGAPDFSTLLDVDIQYNNPYTTGTQYTCDGAIYLYAEHEATVDFVGSGKRVRFVSHATRYTTPHYLALLPDTLVTGENADHSYLNNQPVVATDTNYTQYAAWMVHAVNTVGTPPYTFTPISWQGRKLCHHPGNVYSHSSEVDNGLFLYDPISSEAVDYAYNNPDHPDPFTGENRDYLHFDIETYGSDDDRYVVISPYRLDYRSGHTDNVADHLGLANADKEHKWINAYYGTVDTAKVRELYPTIGASAADTIAVYDSVCQRDFWHTRWKEEHAWLTPPDISMNPSGKVTLKHRLETAPFADATTRETALANLHYYYTTDGTDPSFNAAHIVADSGGFAPNSSFNMNTSGAGSTQLYDPAQNIKLLENQTIKVVAVLTSPIQTEQFSFRAHISRPLSFTAKKCAMPTLENGIISNADGDSIVAVVVTGTHNNKISWDSTAAGYKRDIALTFEMMGYRSGDQLIARAYLPNKLQSDVLTVYQHRGLVVEVVGTPTTTSDSAAVHLTVTTDYVSNNEADPTGYDLIYTRNGESPDTAAAANLDTLTVMATPAHDYNYTASFPNMTDPVTFRVMAKPKAGDGRYTASEVVTRILIPTNYNGATLEGAGTPASPYLISTPVELWTVATKMNGSSNSTYNTKWYRVTADIDMTGINLESIGYPSRGTGIKSFNGRFDGGYHVISHLTHPLFGLCTGAHIYNVVVDESQISNDSDHGGAICVRAEGSTRIYNCGVRSSDKENPTSVTATFQYFDPQRRPNYDWNADAGGIVGQINGDSRVVNCYNFATVSSQYGKVGGIVGTVKGTFSTKNKAQCIVFACANYGKLESEASGKQLYPTIGGKGIGAVQSNMNLYNYYWVGHYGKTDLEDKMNTDGTYGFEAKHLNRFEVMRYILNTKRKHSGWWVMAGKDFNGTDANNAATTLNYFNDTVKYDVGDSVLIGTWVLDTTIAPFPVVLPKYDENGDLIVYRSIINPDYDSAWRDNAAPYQGRRLTEWWRADNDDNHRGRLKVTVRSTEHTVINDTVLWISITDMDTLAYDWNYGKIQLPYYQSVFHTPKISTDDYIVTGWKITSVTGGTLGSLATSGINAYNFADRNCTSKDIYSSTNKRVFAQGGYYNVPYGVTEITITAHWGKAYYVCETNNDKYSNSTSAEENTMYGTASRSAYGEDKEEKENVTVYTTIAEALKHMSSATGTTVYDQAIVLLSDVHYYNSAGKNAFTGETNTGTNNNSGKMPFTLTTIDEDYDNEPDHCMFHYFNGRCPFNPIRIDFIPYLDYCMSGVHNEAYKYQGIPLPTGHFEITETAQARYYQFEYENTGNTSKAEAPLILNGGVFEQMVTVHTDNPAKRTTYIQMGGHVWFKVFAPGTHPDNKSTTKYCPVTVTGGQYEGFYLSSYLKTVSNDYSNNNPVKCYISGGRIGEYASCGNESVTGDATVKVDHLIVDNFFGGGINSAEKITGNIDVTIDSSIVHGIFAAGPKFGSMNTGKVVTTHATGTTFGTYYGAGYGGTATSPAGSLLQSSKEKGKFRFATALAKYSPGKYTIAGTHHNDIDTNVDHVSGVEIDYYFELMPFSSSNGQYVDRVYIRKANLSMAETEAVTSTLTGCTVNGNFYGGGFVGQVKGTATSTLTDCRVMGNVFAGGDNATAPTAKVYPKPDAQKYPLVSSGVILQVDKNELVTPVEYTWTNRLSDFGANVTEVADLDSIYAQAIPGIDIDTTYYYIYTPEDLSLVGKCQATNLTVINTVVGTPGDTNTGSIYGGGNQAAMPVDVAAACTTSVKVEGNTRVYRDVFGAGRIGLVKGNTSVTIGKSGKSGKDHRPLVLGDVYGGGELADVEGNTHVTMYEGVTGPIYGGGNKGSIICTETTTGTAPNTTTTYTPHNTSISILGGYVGYRPDYKGKSFEEGASDSIQLKKDIIDSLLLTDANLKPDVKAVGRPKMYYGVFGGGYGYGTVVTGKSTVTIGDASNMNGNVKIYGSVYGGGEAGQVGGGFRTSTFDNADYMYDSASNTIVPKGDAAVAGTQYLHWDNPTNWLPNDDNDNDGWGDVATVSVVPDGRDVENKDTIEIAGAVFGGGRGYFVTTVEDDGSFSGTESDVTQPHAGAVYGNTSVTIGAADGDTSHLRIGSFNFFTEYEHGRRYKIADTLSLTSQAVFWDQPMWVFDYHTQRYAELTPGDASNVHKVATKTGGWTDWDLSAKAFSSDVRYFLHTGRVSVAGGGERGAVYGQTAVKDWGLRSSDTARSAASRYFGNDGTMLGGNTTVTVLSGTMGNAEGDSLEVEGCVFGAGLSADIDGTSQVTVDGTGAWVRGDVYAGGCMGQVRAYGRAKDANILATQQTLTAGWVRNAFGGSCLTEHGKGCNSQLTVGTSYPDNVTTDEEMATYDNRVLVSESVYGGNGYSPSDGKATMIMNSGKIGYVRAGYAINKGTQYGGDQMEGTLNDIVENNQPNLGYEGNVYGGGFGPEARVTRTEVTMNGGMLRNGVFGGGELAPVMDTCSTASCGTYVCRVVDSTFGDTTYTTHYQTTADDVYRTTVTVNGGTMGMVLGGGRGYTNFLSTKNTYPGTVMGNTKVTLVGGQIHHTTIGSDLGGGNVYGGGLEGEVTGNTLVEVAQGTGKTLMVEGYVFGGGRGYRGTMETSDATQRENITHRASRDAGAVYGNTQLTVTGGTVNGGVYGGGEGMNYSTRVLNYNGYDTVATVHGNATVEIHAGTLGGGYHYAYGIDGHASYAGGRVASVRGWANISVDSIADVSAIYGGNDISGKVMADKNVTRTGTTTALDGTSLAGIETYVKVTGTPKIGRVFGGGNGKYDYYSDYTYNYMNIHTRPEQNSTYVDILLNGTDSASAGYIGAAYGGGNQATVGTAMAVLRNPKTGAGQVDSLYAGGNNATVSKKATVTVGCNKRTMWCNVNHLFGGNNQATMTILPTINLDSGWFGRVFGGGNAGAMTAHVDTVDIFGKRVRNLSTYIFVNSKDVVVRQALYGGCNHARVAGGTYVDVRQTSTKGSLTNARDYGIYQLFGGNDISAYVENSRIDVNGGVVHNIFGGGNGYYDYVPNNDRWNAYDKVTGMSVATYVPKEPYVNVTRVNIWGGEIRSAIYGGGYAGNCGETHVVVNDTAGVQPATAAQLAAAKQDETATTGAIIEGEIYGGGYGYEEQILAGAPVTDHVGNVNGTAYVDLYHVDSLRGTQAYGGGKSGNVVNTCVTVHPGWEKRLEALYGGCWGGDVTGTARVVMNCKVPEGDGFNVASLYGGNDFTGNVYRSVLTVNDGRYQNIYGGGNGDYGPGKDAKYKDTTYTFGTMKAAVPVPNSQFPVINFNNGIVTQNMYGGGNIGTCIVKDTLTTVGAGYPNLEDYALVQVNVHGGTFKNNIFAGASGRNAVKGTRPLIHGLKMLNMDNGLVRQSVYGGTESLDDGYKQECKDSTHSDGALNKTTLRPSSILNLTGGTVMNNVYGAGYLGNVYGSVYVNIGQEAVNTSRVYNRLYNGISYNVAGYKPTFVTTEEADTSSSLMMRPLYLNHSVYNGANWGDAESGYIFETRGFFGGESRILIDGLGYNTHSNDAGNSDPDMDILYSLIGAGTSCEGGDVHRDITVRNYGHWEGCDVSKTLWSIQRADSVTFRNTAIRLSGDQDAATAYASTRYSMNRCDTILFRGENVLRLDQPVVKAHSLVFRDDNGALVDDTAGFTGDKLYTMRRVLSSHTDCNDDCAKVQAVQGTGYTSLLVNNGSYIDVYYQDTTNRGADTVIYGEVKGYAFLRAEDATQAIVTARYKGGSTNMDDGGFFSLCPHDNDYSTTDSTCHGIDGGRRHGADTVYEFEFGNHGTSYRAWKMGKGKRLRHITITAHSDLTELNDQNKLVKNAYGDHDFAVAKAVLELPPTDPKHYYTISGGIVVDQENRELNLVDGAILPADYSGNVIDHLWESTDSILMEGDDTVGVISKLNHHAWLTHNRQTVQNSAMQKLVSDPSHNFGLLITAGSDAFSGQCHSGTNCNTTAAIYSNSYFTGTNGYITDSITGTSNVVPSLDVFLTYNPDFTTTLLGDVSFTLTEWDENGIEVGTIDVLISISTVIKEFQKQEVTVVAIHNEFDNHEYLRKVVLPASLVRRNLYLTSIQWEPTTNNAELFNLQSVEAGRPTDNKHFALKVSPTEDLSASLTTTLGWHEINTQSIDLYQQATGDTSGSEHNYFSNLKGGNLPKGLYIGVLDGRSSAGMEVALSYNGDEVYEDKNPVGVATLTFEYYDQNTTTSIGTESDVVSGSFNLVINVRTRSRGDTIYMASADTLERDSIRLIHWSDTTHACRSCTYYDKNLKGREPIQYLQTFAEVMEIYDDGDVICILDTVIITGDENDAIHGSRYNFVPVVRYSGNHPQFPGKKRAYRGPMISLRETGKLSTEYMIFDGSLTSKRKIWYAEAGEWEDTVELPFTDYPKNGYQGTGTPTYYYATSKAGWEKDTLAAFGPIFEVRDGGELTLGHKTTIQNNYNKSTTGDLGGAIRMAIVRQTDPDDPRDTAGHKANGWYRVHTQAVAIANEKDTHIYVFDTTNTTPEVTVDTCCLIRIRQTGRDTSYYGTTWNRSTLSTIQHPRRDSVYLVRDSIIYDTSDWQAPNPLVVLNNTVTIKNILTDAVNSGAIHMQDGTLTLGIANEGTHVSIDSNYHKGTGQFWVEKNNGSYYAMSSTSMKTWTRANVYLDRTKKVSATGDAAEMQDSTNRYITFSNELSPDTRVGVSKVFPGGATTTRAALRDTIRVAQVTGTHQQYMKTAYENGNFYNDGRLAGASHALTDTFYHPALSTFSLFLQRCATFQKQMYAADGEYYELPVMQYRMNPHAACPNGTDTAVFSVHGGCYPYTYVWTMDTGYHSSVIKVREYTTPYQHDKVKAEDTTGSQHLKARASNSDSALLAGMLLDKNGVGDTFIYTVTATDNFGCKLQQKFAVKMSRVESTSTVESLVLKDPIAENDPDLKYAWGDTNVTGRNNDSTAIDTATRTYKAVHFEAIPLASSDWGTITCTRDGFDGTDIVASSDPLCPGDVIFLNAQATTDHDFIQWGFDPYDVPQTVFVMPNSGSDVTVYGYFGPKTYWKDIVTSEPTSGITTDYNGDLHISDANGLAWFISLANGLNGVQARTFFYDTVFLARGTYDMSAHLWTPLGTSQHPFMGVLMPEPSGSGNVIIKGIIVNEPSMASVGFFGHLDSATVQDITLQKSHFVGQQYVGALAGESSTSKLTNITVQDESSLEQSADNLTTMITANYASGGLIGKSVKDTIKNNAVAALYMGATIYNGGMVGHATDVKASNTWTWSKPRMSSLYSGGAFGYSSGSTFDTLQPLASAAKSRGGSQIVNCYVHYDNPDGKVTRAGGLVGRARNTYIANNYVYGENSAATLTGALGAVMESGVRVENCFFEQGFDSRAFGYRSQLDSAGVTTFSGSGRAVILTDTLGNNSNLARQLNRWVYAHGDTTLHYWHSDTTGENNGYPVFGEPEYEAMTATRELATCDSLLVAGLNFSTSGTYYYHVVDSAEFTDTAVTLYLTVNYSELTELTDSVRAGNDYEGHGFYLTAAEIELLRQTLQEEGTATVVVSDTLQTVAGCDSIVNLYLTIGSPLSTFNSQLSTTLRVYPNPTTKNVTVEADGLQEVELYDAVSRKLSTLTANRSTAVKVDLESYPAGPYYLRIRTENGTVIKKVIKR